MTGYVEELALAQISTCAVTQNGSVGFAFDRDNNKTCIFEGGMSLTTAQKLLDLAVELNLVAQYYNGITGDVYACPTSPDHIRLLKRYAGLVGKEQIIGPYEDAMKLSLSAKLLILTEDPDALIAICRERFSADDFHLIRGTAGDKAVSYFVEFLPPNVNKGEGFRKVCEYIGVSPSEMITFGDGDNDYEMLVLAGCGCAMKNATDMTKKGANIVLEVRISVHFITIIHHVNQNV